MTLKVSKDLKQTLPPTEKEVEIIRTLDPLKIYTGGGLRNLTFESYMNMLDASYEKLRVMFK